MNAATSRPADPVEDHIAALAVALRGPRRVKTRLIEEMRDGLVDATAAQTADGEPYERAAHRAVREFGATEELIPACQRELTIAQTRHTAWVVTLTAAVLVSYWRLVWITNGDHAWGLPRGVAVLGAHLAGMTTVAALLATLTLAATGVLARWLPMPPRLPLAVAWAGTMTSTAMALTTLALAVASAFATSWLLTLFGGALAAAAHAALAPSARACRQCARLPTTSPAPAPSRH